MTVAPLTDELAPYLSTIFQRKAVSVTALDIRGLTSYTDALIIVEASSSRQVTSIAEHIVKTLKQSKLKVLGAEGIKQGEWALLDYGHTVIHVFESQTRALYDLEGFWADAPKIDLSGFDHSTREE